MKETKRQLQVAELVRRNMGIMLQQEGGLIYGTKAFVTVTGVKMSPDLGIAKVYLSIYNIEDKHNVILLLENEYTHVKNAFYQRIRRHMRRMPELQFYIDDTLDEMYRLNAVFDNLDGVKKEGKGEEE